MDEGKVKKSEYAHDTFLLRTEYWEQIHYMSDEQKGRFLTKIYQYAKDETEENTDDPLIEAVFCTVKAWLNTAWDKYDREKEVKAKRDKLGGIMAQLKAGHTLDAKSVTYLQENGCVNRRYLSDKGIPEDIIRDLLNRVGYKRDDSENLPFD